MDEEFGIIMMVHAVYFCRHTCTGVIMGQSFFNIHGDCMYHIIFSFYFSSIIVNNENVCISVF